MVIAVRVGILAKALTFEGNHTGIKEVSISDLRGNWVTVRVNSVSLHGNRTLLVPTTFDEARKATLLLEE